MSAKDYKEYVAHTKKLEPNFLTATLKYETVNN